jgi:hypothetical protein
VLGPYERVVLGRNRAEDWTAAHVSPVAFYGDVGLNNDGESLMLVDGDRVLFSTPHFASFGNGASWQLINSWAPSDLASWALATQAMGGDEFGTPGY